jgi:hypothetical protein
MAAAQPSKGLHPLCHEHHIKMKLDPVLSKNEGKDARLPVRSPIASSTTTALTVTS